jgi:hypothetical protein
VLIALHRRYILYQNSECLLRDTTRQYVVRPVSAREQKFARSAAAAATAVPKE